MTLEALNHYLAPLMSYLSRDGVTEICINKPGEIFIEQYKKFTRYIVTELDYDYLLALSSLVAEFNNKDFPAPLLSGSLPTGERIQFAMNPACENNKIICSIRRHQMADLSLNDYAKMNAFENFINENIEDNGLNNLFLEKEIVAFLKKAIQKKKNILISGGTGTGKTTFLNACLKCIPEYERIITVEDTREVIVHQPNAAHLLFSEEDNGISALKIFKACLRLRPDRIFLSEIRGAEVWAYLRAANSGHPGSLSTIHADTPEGAIRQLIFMMQQAGSTSTDEYLQNYIKSIIHIIVQLKRDSSKERYMYVSDIYFNGHV